MMRDQALSHTLSKNLGPEDAARARGLVHVLVVLEKVSDDVCLLQEQPWFRGNGFGVEG